MLKNTAAFEKTCQQVRSLRADDGVVAQVSNLLYRRFPIGNASEWKVPCGLETGDTADWKSPPRGFGPQLKVKVDREHSYYENETPYDGAGHH